VRQPVKTTRRSRLACSKGFLAGNRLRMTAKARPSPRAATLENLLDHGWKIKEPIEEGYWNQNVAAGFMC
jgi:hypothetical protein